MEPLPITDKTAEALTAIAKIEQSRLSGLVSDLSSNTQYMRSKDIVATFDTHVGTDVGRTLLGHIASLNLMRDDNGDNAESIFQALHDGIVDAGFTELEEGIVARKDNLISLINDESVYLSIKGARLFSADALHLHEFKVFCDVRPVFGPHRQNIHAFLLYTTMNIVASDDQENEKRFTVALRQKDIKNLIKECETAIKKLDAVEAAISSVEDIGIIRYGRD